MCRIEPKTLGQPRSGMFGPQQPRRLGTNGNRAFDARPPSQLRRSLFTKLDKAISRIQARGAGASCTGADGDGQERTQSRAVVQTVSAAEGADEFVELARKVGKLCRGPLNV